MQRSALGRKGTPRIRTHAYDQARSDALHLRRGRAQVETTPDGYRRTPRGDLVVPCRSAAAAGAAAALCARVSPGAAVEQGMACSKAAGRSHAVTCRANRLPLLEALQTSLESVQAEKHRA